MLVELETYTAASTRVRPYFTVHISQVVRRPAAAGPRGREGRTDRTADGAASREYDDWHASASRRATRETDGTSQYAEGTLPRHPIHDLPFGEQSGFEQRDRPSGFGFKGCVLGERYTGSAGKIKGATRQRGPKMP